MDTSIRSYHFTKSISKDSVTYFSEILECHGIICFDFEDSINYGNKQQTTLLKTSHRKAIIDTLKNGPVKFDLNKIGFRINRIESSYYREDIAAVCKLENVNCVFLPKVESRLHVKKILRDLPLSINEVIPIIETKAGLENIEEILSINNSRFLRIAFGHCDFNLSNKYFPFFHQDSKVYWNWVKFIANHAEIAGKHLINSPVLNLDDSKYFSQIVAKNRSYRNITGQITLCLKQTLLCAHPKSFPELSLKSSIKNVTDKYKLALEIIESFEKYQVKYRLFAIDKNRNLISPQEYRSAKEFITKSLE